MDKNEAYQQIIYKLKEIDGTRIRLGSAKSESRDIEIALLNQQIINLYQALQHYRSGLYASQPTTNEAIIETRETALEPVPAENKPSQSSDYLKVAKSEPKETPVPQVELKRESADNAQRKERIKRLEAEAAMMEMERREVESNRHPVPKSAEEDFTKIVEEKYEEADRVAQVLKNAATRKEDEINISKNKPATEKTLNEKLQSGSKLPESLNEKFQNIEPKKSLADKMKLGPISDLKSAIALNQKIVYTNALFGGDDKEFKKALNFLSNCTNFSEAKFYLQSEIGKIFRWNESDPIVEEFTELVYRKFL